MIALIDYDAGNTRSVEKALNFLGEESLLTRDREALLRADKVILPGVGNFGEAMETLNRYGLISVIHEIVEKRPPFWVSAWACSFCLRRARRRRGFRGWGF